jgi:xanthine dehydrogenase molybdenum-binding subunit
MHPKRHPLTLDYAVGCDADGNLTAVRARIVGDSGAFASVGAKVLERAAGHACGPYRVPAVDVEALAVYTHNPPCGAMRGFGVAQAAFALEGCVDMLAAMAGVDPWAMRRRNLAGVGDRLTTGQRVTHPTGMAATLDAVKPAYDAARAQGLAVGLACALKNSGIGNGVEEWGRARLVVEPDGTVSLYNGYTEMGQGLSTVLVQFAREVTGLPAGTFVPRTDTRYALACGQTTGSRATLHGGNAVIAAARKLRAALDAGGTLASLAGREFSGEVAVRDTDAIESAKPDPKTHTAYGWATQLVALDAHGRVSRVVAAHDVGRAVNPSLCAAQVEGAVAMGLGYALTEELACEGGMPVTFWLRDLGALRAKDVPPIEVILVEAPEPEGPFGAKGVGEIGMVPTAAAVANALAVFEGRRRFTLPMKDAAASRAMGVGHPHHHRGAPGHDHDHDHHRDRG